MRKPLINQKNLRRVRHLSLLFALLFIPQGTWATDYELWIGGTQVTDANKDNLPNYNDSIYSEDVTFDPTTSTLTIGGGTIGVGIRSNLNKLIIRFYGECVISNSLDNTIWSYNPNAELIFERGDDEYNYLGLESKQYSHSVIYGFDKVTYRTGIYAHSDEPLEYTSYNGTKAVRNASYNSNYANYISDISISSDEAYPLWVWPDGYNQYYQVTDEDLDDVFGDENSSFTPATNTLTLNGVVVNSPIISGLDNLQIEFSGANSFEYLQSTNANATLTLKATATESTINISNTIGTTAIGGFTSVTLGEGTYLHTDNGYFHFNKTTKQYEGMNGGIQDLQITTTPYYMLWIGSVGSGFTQATNGVLENYLTNIEGSVSFEPSTNTLTLNGATIDGDIYSVLGDLNIELTGSNLVKADGAYPSDFKPITSENGGKVTFMSTSGTGSLQFKNQWDVCYSILSDVIGNFTTAFKNDLVFYPGISEIKAMATPTIAFQKRDQTTGGETNDFVGESETLETDYAATFYAPAPVFNDGWVIFPDTSRYEYSCAPEGIVEFPITSTDATTGKITYGEMNILKAGTVTITCTFPGNEQNKPCTASYTLKVNPKSIETATLSTIADQTYTGSAITPEPTVTLGNTTLTKGTDYTLAYSGNTNVGTVTITATGTGNYTGTATTTFNIVAKNIETATFSTIADQTYTGSAITPEPTVTVGNTTLTKGTDYTLAYSGNTNVGTVTITATGTGNYTGTATTTFQIVAKALTANMVTLSATEFSYNGSLQKPTVTVKDGSVTLVEGTDYTLTNNGGTDANTYNVVVTGMGNYSSAITKTFTISVNAGALTVTPTTASYTYDGTEKKPAVTVKSGTATLTENTEYTVTYSNNINAGTATVTVTGVGNYAGATGSATFTIVAKTLTADMVTLSPAEVVANGSLQKPTVTVKDGTVTLVEGTDYTLTNNGGTEADTYNVVVTGMGNYSSTITKTFTITKHIATLDELGFTSEYQTYASYYNEEEDMYLPDGVVAYVITDVDGTDVTLQRISFVPKGVAVLIEMGTTSEVVDDQFTDNMLHGTTVPTDVDDIEGGTVYVLYEGEFVKCTQGTIPANRCYLLVPGDSNARRLSIGHSGDNTTGIAGMNQMGQEQWYDLQGRKIEKPTKPGLYILNGKKVVVRNHYNNK